MPDSFKAAVVAGGNLEKLGVTQFQATIQGKNLNLDGTAKIDNVLKMQGVAADLFLDIASLAVVEDIAKVKLPPLGAIKATANIASKGENLGLMEIKANLESDIVHADVDGSVSDPAKLQGVKAAVNLGVDTLDWLERELVKKMTQLVKMQPHGGPKTIFPPE